MANSAPKFDQFVWILLENTVHLHLFLFGAEVCGFKVHEHSDLLVRCHIIDQLNSLLFRDLIPDIYALFDANVVPKALPLRRVKSLRVQ